MFLGLGNLYELAGAMGGIPYGSTEFVQADSALRRLIEKLRQDSMAIRTLQSSETFDLVRELLRVITQGTSPDELRGIFSKLEEGNLQNLNAGLSLAQLEQARD